MRSVDFSCNVNIVIYIDVIWILLFLFFFYLFCGYRVSKIRFSYERKLKPCDANLI